MPLALVAELVDALDSKSSFFGSVGSIPTQGTALSNNNPVKYLFYRVFSFIDFLRSAIYPSFTQVTQTYIKDFHSLSVLRALYSIWSFLRFWSLQACRI